MFTLLELNKKSIFVAFIIHRLCKMMMIAMVFFSFTEKLSATWASIRKQHKMRPTDQAHQSPCNLKYVLETIRIQEDHSYWQLRLSSHSLIYIYIWQFQVFNYLFLEKISENQQLPTGRVLWSTTSPTMDTYLNGNRPYTKLFICEKSHTCH